MRNDYSSIKLLNHYFALAVFPAVEQGWVLDIIKAMTSFLTRTVAAALSGLVILCAGCSRGPALSPLAASQLAAKLANEQCDSLYQQRPFSASQHLAVLRKGAYKWGGFDATGPDGFSALVSFRADGSAPQVEVYFSCDPVLPRIIHTPSHPEGIPVVH